MFILDCVIAVLLMVSIVYSWQLNKKISELRSHKKDFLELIKILDKAILKAEYGIDELKLLSNQVGLDLNNKIDKAKYIYDDLSYITDRAVISSEKLDGLITDARKFEKFDFVQFHQEQLEKYKKSIKAELPFENKVITNDAINDFESIKFNDNKSTINNGTSSKPIQKVAIESLLARISAVKTNRKEKVV